MRHIMVLLFVMMTSLTGCAHVMSEANLQKVDKTLTFEEVKKNADSCAGRTVLVGGIVAGVKSTGDMLMLEVTQLELFKNGVPDEESVSLGRFLVVSSDLVDPVIYRPGRLVTVIGEVKGKKVQPLESVDYVYPLIAAREIRVFRPSEPISPISDENPYQNRIDDNRLQLRPPGPAEGEPKNRKQ